MTTGKTIALTRQTFVGKVLSLLFKILSRLVITFLPRSKRLLILWLQSPLHLQWFWVVMQHPSFELLRLLNSIDFSIVTASFWVASIVLTVLHNCRSDNQGTQGYHKSRGQACMKFRWPIWNHFTHTWPKWHLLGLIVSQTSGSSEFLLLWIFRVYLPFPKQMVSITLYHCFWW